MQEINIPNPIRLFHTLNNGSIACNSGNKYLIHPGNTTDVYFKSGLDLKPLPFYTDRQIEAFTHNNQIILRETASPSLDQNIRSFLAEKKPVKLLPLLIGAIALGDNSSVVAGNSLFVTITAKNKGTDNLYRVKAVLSSTEPLFDGVTFFLGKVEPKKQNSATAAFLIPDRWPERDIPVTVEFIEANGVDCSPLKRRLAIKPKTQPRR